MMLSLETGSLLRALRVVQLHLHMHKIISEQALIMTHHKQQSANQREMYSCYCLLTCGTTTTCLPGRKYRARSTSTRAIPAMANIFAIA